MTEFMSIADQVKDLGSTILIVAAAIWFGFQYLPSQTKQQGQITEIIHHNITVIENCTEALKLVSARDEDVKETLSRLEKHLEDVRADLRTIEQNNLSRKD